MPEQDPHFPPINGSARHDDRDGRSYYWGRAGRADERPLASGGAYIRWHTASQPWHGCRAILPTSQSDWVRTPAVASTIAGKHATIQVCLWRDQWKDKDGKVWDPELLHLTAVTAGIESPWISAVPEALVTRGWPSLRLHAILTKWWDGTRGARRGRRAAA